jgi:hypothetical protein
MEENIKEDFLEVDSKIPGQNYVCLSFVSPDKLIKQKEIYFATKFLDYIINNEDFHVQKIRENMLNNEVKINYENVAQLYEDWKYSIIDDLEQDFFEKSDYKTSMRGIKVRGTYDTYKEAKIRAEVLRRKDPSFNVFVGQVGYWLPWDPESHTIQEQEYQEGQLNELVKKYKENLSNRDVLYDQMKNEKIEKAKKELEIKKEQIKSKNASENNNENNTNTEEDTKNIETLRNIVDTSNKIFYDNLKANQTNNITNDVSNDVSTNVSNDVSNDVSTNVTNDVSNDISNDVSTNVTIDNVSNDLSTNNNLNNFIIDSMSNLESDDPWMKNKNK